MDAGVSEADASTNGGGAGTDDGGFDDGATDPDGGSTRGNYAVGCACTHVVDFGIVLWAWLALVAIATKTQRRGRARPERETPRLRPLVR
jgi:hypothetical protein